MKSTAWLIALLSPLCLFSQSKKFTFKLGEEYELPKHTADVAFIGNQKDGIVNLSLKKEDMNIIRFNPKSLSVAMQDKIDLDVSKNFDSEIVTDFAGTDQYYWIYSDWDKKSEKEMLFYDQIDLAKAKLNQSHTKMFETTKVAGTAMITTGLYSYKMANKYQFDYDADRSRLLVSYRLYPEVRNDKKNYDKLGFQVFNSKLEKLWGGEYKMPYTEAVMDNSDFSIDGNGNAYLLAKVYNDDSRKEKDKETGAPAYHFEILKFVKDASVPVVTPVVLENNFIRFATLIENPQHDMVIACTYSKKSKGTGTDGVFLAVLDKEGKIVKYKNGYYEFPKDELVKFESDRLKRKMEKSDYENPDLRVHDVLIQSDGSLFFTCEEYYSKSRSYYTMGHWDYRTDYYYENVYAADISASGDFQWMRKIPKRQSGTIGSNLVNYTMINNLESNTLGFKLIADSTGYYFLYLDNIHNMHLQENELPKYHVNGAGGQVVVSKIDNGGNVTKELVFDTRDEDIMIYPTRFKKIYGNQFIGRAKIKKTLFQPVLISAK